MKQIFLFGTSLLVCVSVWAAPAPAPGLGFDVTTRITATGKNQFPTQTMQGRVVLSGSRARVESVGGSTRSVVLYTPPFVYRLLPDDKAGVKWKLSKVRGSDIGGFDPQQLLRNPSQIRAALLANGAKRSGVTQLNGVPVDIFDISRPGQRFSKARAWLRRSDSLPVRLEATNGGIKVSVLWSRYTKLPRVSATQFTPPKGFVIRESQNPPLLPLL